MGGAARTSAVRRAVESARASIRPNDAATSARAPPSACRRRWSRTPLRVSETRAPAFHARVRSRAFSASPPRARLRTKRPATGADGSATLWVWGASSFFRRSLQCWQREHGESRVGAASRAPRPTRPRWIRSRRRMPRPKTSLRTDRPRRARGTKTAEARAAAKPTAEGYRDATAAARGSASRVRWATAVVVPSVAIATAVSRPWRASRLQASRGPVETSAAASGSRALAPARSDVARRSNADSSKRALSASPRVSSTPAIASID